MALARANVVFAFFSFPLSLPTFRPEPWTPRTREGRSDFRFGTAALRAFVARLAVSWPGFRKLAETVSSVWQVNQSLGISNGGPTRVPSDLFAAEIPERIP